jgi:hypothetical protein
MSDERRSDEKRKLPDFNVFFVPEREGAKWIQIGALWKNKDKEGFSGFLDIATSGRIVLLPPKAKDEDDQPES